MCHKQRNLAEYEGHLEVPPQLFSELVEVTEELLTLVEALGARQYTVGPHKRSVADTHA